MKLKTRPRSQIIEEFYAGRGVILAAGPNPPGSTDIGGAPAAPAPSTTPPPAKGDDAPAKPTGDVDNDAVCQDPTCGHLGSGHEDTEAGANTGACTMMNGTEACACQQMQPPDATDVDDETKPDAAPAKPAPTAAPAAATVEGAETLADAPAGSPGDSPDDVQEGAEAPAAAPGADSGAGAPAAAPGVVTDASSEGGDQETGAGSGTGGPGDAGTSDAPMGAAFTIPVLVVEGTPTSDGREIAPNALTWRTPPLPLMGLDNTSPFGHDGAVICGRIDAIVRDGSTISATGFFLDDENGAHFADLVATQAVKGISVDIADVDSTISISGLDDLGGIADAVEILMSGEIMGATLCPFPALSEAYIILDSASDDDGDVDIPMQQAAAAQAREHFDNAAGIHVLNVRECHTCTESDGITASIAPLAPPPEWFAPVTSDGQPGFDELTPLTVTDDGRIFGHVAPFGVCHIGIQGECVMAPRSSTGYALFHQGYVVCSDGSIVSTGPISMNGEHASQSGKLTAAQTRAHYDNTCSRFADVHAGDDEWGVWVAGVVDPEITDEDIRRFRASAVSGDWRWHGRGHELVAALAVNTPGFPVVTASVHNGQVMSIVAAGAPQMMRLAQERAGDPIEARLDRIERTQRIMAPLAASALRSRYEAARSR